MLGVGGFGEVITTFEGGGDRARARFSFLLSFLLLEVGWMGVEALIWREREEEEGQGG